MSSRDPENRAADRPSEDPSEAALEGDNTSSEVADRPREIGGRGGLDPTRYGDWEKAGRCIDF